MDSHLGECEANETMSRERNQRNPHCLQQGQHRRHIYSTAHGTGRQGASADLNGKVSTVRAHSQACSAKELYS